MRIEFRHILAEDLELQKDLLFIALWTPAHVPGPSRDILQSPRVREYYQDWGRQGDIGLFAIDADQTVLGFVQLRQKYCITKDYAELPELAIAVLPSHQGQGLGACLLDEIMARVMSSVKGIRLGVNPENQAAIALYKSRNFEFYANPEGAYPQMVWLNNKGSDD
ncbi:GNAT family N-acetyltransferase [Bacterioplanes sanyensis]|uniref:GNAT family N-acetyltransferase n=1 Tax=Bacterioplanes sanyensis TaxID=1249553 RepID=UPI0012FD0C8D|nr:N-acetyltransferase [Bacterioplanes sanyensis]